jgi:hypothetical protein
LQSLLRGAVFQLPNSISILRCRKHLLERGIKLESEHAWQRNLTNIRPPAWPVPPLAAPRRIVAGLDALLAALLQSSRSFDPTSDRACKGEL